MLKRYSIRSGATVLAAAMFLLSESSRGDTVFLKGNRTVTGRITADTAQSVSIEAAEGRFTFSRTQVVKITKDSPAQNQLMDVTTLLQRGELERALALFRVTGLEKKLAPDTLESLLLQSLGDTAATAIATTQTATMLAQRFLQKPQPPLELLLFTAALSADAGLDDLAMRLVQKIPLPLSRQPVWPDSTVSLLLNRIADAAVVHRRGDLVGATAALATQISPEVKSTNQAFLVEYSRIDEFRRNGDLLRATALFRPDYFLHRADLFRPLAERVLASIMASGSQTASIAALESARTTILPFVDERLQVQAVKMLLSSLVAAGRAVDAQSIADEISDSNPDLGAVALHLVEFHRRKSALPEGMPLEKYKLAAWARSMGLTTESRGIFLELRRDPRFAENASIQLELIENSRCQDEVTYLRRLFDDNRLEKLKAEANLFLNSAPPEPYAAKARDFVQLAEFQKWSATKSALGQAEAEFQQAERLANRGEYDAALLQLNRLQISTEKAGRAKTLRDRILQEKARERIKAAKQRDAE